GPVRRRDQQDVVVLRLAGLEGPPLGEVAVQPFDEAFPDPRTEPRLVERLHLDEELVDHAAAALGERMRHHPRWLLLAVRHGHGTAACFAMALARKVLPVPGGPSNRMPRRGLPPSTSRNVTYPMNTLSVRVTSSTCGSRPFSSSSPTSMCSGRISRWGDRLVTS